MFISFWYSYYTELVLTPLIKCMRYQKAIEPKLIVKSKQTRNRKKLKITALYFNDNHTVIEINSKFHFFSVEQFFC